MRRPTLLTGPAPSGMTCSHRSWVACGVPAGGGLEAMLRGVREPLAAVETSSADIALSAFIVVAVALVGFWLWSLIDVLSWPPSTWDATELSKARWVLRILLVPFGIGAMLYVSSPRRLLRAAYHDIRWREPSEAVDD